jgi:predicted transcriptional regulator
MIQEILTYQKLVNGIDELMNKSPFKKNYIIEQVGIPGPTFYRKLKSQSFTPEEMLSIAKILSPEEYFMMELKAEIEQGKLDYKEGRFIKHEDVLKEMKIRRKKA